LTGGNVPNNISLLRSVAVGESSDRVSRSRHARLNKPEFSRVDSCKHIRYGQQVITVFRLQKHKVYLQKSHGVLICYMLA